MIGFSNCHFAHADGDDRKVVLFDASLCFEPNERICVLAHSGSGKSTILGLLRGFLEPQAGDVRSAADTSWPVGAAGAFHPALTGEENVRTIAMMLSIDPDWATAYALAFSELGADFFKPLKTYSAGKRARLSYAFSYAAPAKLFLAEDSVGTGSPDFVKRCEAAMAQRLETSGLFLISRNPRICETFGDRFFVLANGAFEECRDFADAKDRFTEEDSQIAELHDLVDSLEGVE